MTRDEIMNQLNAEDWSSIVAVFCGRTVQAIKRELDAMFPHTSNNTQLAQEIHTAIVQTRLCRLAIEHNGVYTVHPNSDPEAWIDIISHTEVDNVMPIEELHGWGWGWAYRVQIGPDELIYFVEEAPDITEGPCTREDD